jgi:hypothetical protein
MATRNRIHKSSLHRYRGPTHTHDFPVEGRKKRRAEEGIVSPRYNTEREMKWDQEGRNLQTDRDYGSGSRAERPIEGNRYAPQIGREGKAPGDLTRRSYWNDADYEEPRPHNNYDDYDRVYPPSWRP